MIEVRCPNCNSEDVYFSKKRLKYVCEDCEYEFMDKETLIPKRVFISYAHDEYAVFVDEVYAILKGIGVNIWKDDYEIKGGDDWRRSITEGIKQSSHVIAFISTKSIRNPGVCLDELQIAVSQNKNIIPIRFDNVELPSSISYLQWKDVGQDKSQTIADYILQQIVKNENVSDSLKSLEQKFCPFSFATKLKILYSNNNFIRNDILQQVDEWVLSAKKLLWIKGNPGTGKSIIAGQVYSRRSYVNSIFFCEWEMSRVTTFSSIVKTIAFQLAQRNADYRDLLESVDISQVADNNLLYEIIVKPFQQLINGNRDIKVIWIDAIDELSTEVCNELIKEFLIAIKILPTWLKIVFTSRYKEEYDKHYDNDFIRCLDLEEYNTESLIKEYVLYEFDRKSFKGKNNDILAEKIAKNSNGVFLYVDAVVSDIISNNKLQIIDNVPSSLYSLFEKYFDRAIRLNSVDKEFLLKLLGLIIVCKEVATVDYLSTILNEDEGVIIKELSFVSNYFLLFNENGDNIVKPYHKALVDWFKKLTINDPYYIDFNFINCLLLKKVWRK